MEEFAERWRSRGFAETFECFYDTMDPGRVIVEKMYSINDVIHSMTWPSVAVIICGLVFLRLQTRRHKLTLCGRRGTPSSQTASNDLVKQPLRHHQQDLDEHCADHCDDQKMMSISHLVAPPPGGRVSTGVDDDLDYADCCVDDLSCRDDSESQQSYATPTPQPSCTSSTSSVTSPIYHHHQQQQRPHLVNSASTPALDDETRRTDTCSSSRPLSASHSAADVTT